MGYRYAQAATHIRWAKLSDRAFRVLTFLAWQVRDKENPSTPAGEYWGGHEAIAVYLSGASREPNDGDIRKVRRAVKELLEAGAIVRVEQAANGLPPRYRLDLDHDPDMPQLDLTHS